MDGLAPKQYEEEIQIMRNELIKEPEQLKAVLAQYDSLVKQQIANSEGMELPYWCYCSVEGK